MASSSIWSAVPVSFAAVLLKFNSIFQTFQVQDTIFSSQIHHVEDIYHVVVQVGSISCEISLLMRHDLIAGALECVVSKANTNGHWCQCWVPKIPPLEMCRVKLTQDWLYSKVATDDQLLLEGGKRSLTKKLLSVGTLTLNVEILSAADDLKRPNLIKQCNLRDTQEVEEL